MPSLLAGVLIKKKPKSKLVYDAHELESKTNSLGKFMYRFIFFVEKFLWILIDYLICATSIILLGTQKTLASSRTSVS